MPSILQPSNAFPGMPFPQHYAQGDFARTFNGSSDYIALGTAFQPTGTISISAWIKFGTTANFAGAVLGGAAGYEFRWTGASSTTGTLTLNQSFTVDIGDSSTQTVATGIWYHVGVSFDGTNLNFYWNGINIGSSSHAVSITVSNGYRMGGLGGGGDFFNGAISDLSAWNVILSSGNFVTLATPTRANKVVAVSQTGYWPITGATVEADFSGKGNNSTTINGTTVVAGPPGLGTVLYPFMQSYLYPGAVLPNPNPPPPSVLSYTNAFPNLAFPQHGINITADQARSFNGTTDQIATAAYATAALNGATAFSCSVWINHGTLSNAYNCIVDFATAVSGNIYFQILIKSTGKLAYYVLGLGGSTGVDPGSASISGWTHLGLTYDTVAGLKTFVNGASDGTAVQKGVLIGLTNPFVAWGYDQGNAGRHYPGSIADTGLWNTVLTGPQISALAAGTRANMIGANANLIGYWPILGNSPENDLSVGNSPGVLTGTSVVAGPPSLSNSILYSTVRSFLYPGAVQPIVQAAAPAFLAAWARHRNIVEGGRAN